MGGRVRQVVASAQDVTDLVVQAGAGRRERDSGQVRPVQRLLAALQVGGVGDDAGQAGVEGADPLGSQRLVDRVGARRPHRVDAVGQRVEPGGHAQVDRQRDHQRGVVDDRAGQDLRVHPGRLGRVLGQAPHVGGLRAGVRGGHRDDRQAAGQGHRLRQAGRRSAADTDEDVDLVLAAARRARSATATGTCMTTSSWTSATGSPSVILLARSASLGAAMTMARVHPCSSTSMASDCAACAGAEPDALGEGVVVEGERH